MVSLCKVSAVLIASRRALVAELGTLFHPPHVVAFFGALVANRGACVTSVDAFLNFFGQCHFGFSGMARRITPLHRMGLRETWRQVGYFVSVTT